MTIGIIIGVIGGLLGGAALTLIYKASMAKGGLDKARLQAEALLNEAGAKAKAIKKEAELELKEKELKWHTNFEKEKEVKQKELINSEKRLTTREEGLEKRFDILEQKEFELKKQDQSLLDRRRNIEGLEKKYNELVSEARKSLESAAGISREEATKRLMDSLIDSAKLEAVKLTKEIEDRAREEADKKAQRIISTAIERMASEYVAERSVSVVPLPGDEMKGRIIGREGRNIRALEAATGVEIVIDDTPEAVVISSFNPVRREVARRSLEYLVQDGRIHPGRIEEVVEKMTKEVDKAIKEAGETALYELGISSVHPDLVKLLGSLKFRYSYGQNMLQHSIEVARLCGMMAAELGLDEKKARRAGILHDIGKAVTHEEEGGHAVIGMDYAKKYREDPEIVHAIGAHHEDMPQETPLDCLVDAADALSGARPGARREVLATYMKRLEDLERISTSFKGIEKAYAIQAGREIRVIVDAGEVSDAQAQILSKDIAKKIESEMAYPGQIKVTVIRETRAVELAK